MSGSTWRFSASIATVLVTACGSGGLQDDRSESPQSQNQCAGLSTPEMVWIKGGTFLLGAEAVLPEEGPAREVSVDGFWISNTEVTNAQFAQFVAETGYKTEAELPPPALPNSPREMQQPGSAVFHTPSADNPNWWRWKVGANWRRPSGPDSDFKGRENDPVVHLTYKDARAYAEWAGGSLPTEDQWEYAARAGQASLPEPVKANGTATANYYQGVFPYHDNGADGFLSRAPVGCFTPNGFGLYDMIGNVWEWTASQAEGGPTRNIIKGGSYLCAKNYCARYRPAARQFQELDLPTDHIGFRIVDNRRPAPKALD